MAPDGLQMNGLSYVQSVSVLLMAKPTGFAGSAVGRNSP